MHCIFLFVIFSFSFFIVLLPLLFYFFFFNDTATTEIYTLSLHDALPIFHLGSGGVHAARHLQQREPREAGLPGRGAPAGRRCAEASPRPACCGESAMSASDVSPVDTDAASSTYAIDVKGLNKHFGSKHVVNDVSLRVQRGEIFGFLGPNGSGKTTCIRMMCGLLTPDSGNGTCLGFDIVRDSAQIKRRVGYMTQRFSYWEDLTIRENLDFVARIYEMKNRRETVDRALENLGLASRSQQLAGALSGGWKQRLPLAPAMRPGPKLLVLDEPTPRR